jgi:putative transcriptional regulator
MLGLESRLYMAPAILNRVKELRVARGWTQEELAHAVGVSRQSINSIERDRYVPSLLLALLFARVFGCSTDQIFTLERKK